MKRAITAKRVEKVGKYDQVSLEKVIGVQEKQIADQAQTIRDLRKQLADTRQSFRAAFEALLTMDFVDEQTGEVFNLIKFEEIGNE